MFIQTLILTFLPPTRLSIFKHGSILAALILFTSPAIAKGNTVEFVVELDAYYSYDDTIWESRQKYRNGLMNSDPDELSVIVRPNFEF